MKQGMLPSFIPERYAKRDSGIELLRILSMLVVVICHAPYLALAHEYDTLQGVRGNFLPFCCNTAESLLAAQCLDVFVLITGFFGIRFTWRGVFNILFIKYFWGLGIGLFAYLFLHRGISPRYIADVLDPFGTDWFITAYLGLFVLAIFFNSFIDTCTRRQFNHVLALYLGLIFVFGWLSPFYSEVFPLRHSAIEFGGLYLLGRYCRKYGIGAASARKRLFLFWIAVTAINACWYIVVRSVVSGSSLIAYLSGLMGCYSSALAFLGALLLVILFSRLKFSSPVINWMAISAISVYVIHRNWIVQPCFSDAVRAFLSYLPPVGEPMGKLLFAIAFYLVCIPFDQIRLLLWGYVEKAISKRR